MFSPTPYDSKALMMDHEREFMQAALVREVRRVMRQSRTAVAVRRRRRILSFRFVSPLRGRPTTSRA